MEKTTQMYEGNAKKVFATTDPDLCIVSYKDDATAFNGLKKGTILGKGAINNRVTNHLMKLVEKNGVPTHLVEELNDRETLVKRVHIVPLEVIATPARKLAICILFFASMASGSLHASIILLRIMSRARSEKTSENGFALLLVKHSIA